MIFIKERCDSVDSGVEVNDFFDKSKLKNITKVAKSLGSYICLKNSGLSHLDNSNDYIEYKECLENHVNKILQENKDHFQKMIKTLGNNSCSVGNSIIQNIAKELFRDCQFNWGRIITLYAFAAELASFGERNSSNEKIGEYARFVGNEVGNFIGLNSAQWIDDQGGWAKMLKFVKKDEITEKGFFKGILITCFGLGIWATWKVMR